MGNDVAIRDEAAPVAVRLSAEQLQYIAHTEFVPKSMRGKLPAILACVAMGRELGLGDMVALRTVHVIDGRTSLSAEAMVALVRKRGHSIQGNFSGDSCTATGKRADNGDEMTVTWTKDMAREAGLATKDNHKKYPAAMLWARAVSQLCRMLFADCFAGSTHTPEEIAEGDFEDFQEIDDSAGEPQALADDVSQPLGAAASPADAPSAAQIKKLNVLVGTLREAGKVTTEDVWLAVGRETLEFSAEDGELHWSPLRDSLTKGEASQLIEWLTSVEAGAAPEREDQRSGPDPSRSEAAPSDAPEPLTVDELKARAAAAGISLARLGQVGKELFPDRGIASDLSDAERGRVLAGALAEVANV